ncbi:hypothetical protein [Chryseobacterium foetidum]|uniref:hypothetical protein n=1 Tax=Chryseobacterium foetidum TaxID=2951057 RepID=UPI0021C8FBDD|nr:hypothetical protein [Chryseobacterium foetidum]
MQLAQFKNWRLGFIFRNNLEKKYSKNMLKIRFNEMDGILFIPHYDTTKYSFPPLNKEQKYVGSKIEDLGIKRRIYAFMEEPVIFFEDNERAGQYFNLDFEYDVEHMDREFHVKYYNLIYCIDSETYKWLYKALRKDFYEFPSGHSFNRENSIYNNALQFIEEKLIQLKEELPDKFRNKIFKEEQL